MFVLLSYPRQKKTYTYTRVHTHIQKHTHKASEVGFFSVVSLINVFLNWLLSKVQEASNNRCLVCVFHGTSIPCFTLVCFSFCVDSAGQFTPLLKLKPFSQLLCITLNPHFCWECKFKFTPILFKLTLQVYN